jgi:hypothetical protein
MTLDFIRTKQSWISPDQFVGQFDNGRVVSVIAQTALALTDKVQLTLLRLNF